MTNGSRWSWFYLLFFVSGAAGLVYQVVWSRLLNQVFGVTVHAVTAVLATFLAGLALGGILLGRRADRSANPLRFYALLELGIGLTGLASAYLIPALDSLHVAAARRFSSSSVALIGVRMILAAAVILPPTFLMGGTLPVMTRALLERLSGLGRKLSLLYGINTLGAVAGSLTAGFTLIRFLGLHGTLWVAAILNLGVGGMALLLARSAASAAPARAPGHAPPRSVAPPARPEPALLPGSASGRGLLIAIALSGFVSLALEVIWTRLLVLIVGTSTYAFVTMLSAFLVGITLGSFLARAFVDRTARLRSVFGWVEIGIAAATLAAVPILKRVNVGEVQLELDARTGQWLALAIRQFGVSFLLMLVPTTLIGMTFPIAGRLFARREETIGGEVGTVYGANTIGNIAGAVAGGFVILPLFGIQRGIALLTILNLVCAAWALLPMGARGRRAAVGVGAGDAAGAANAPIAASPPLRSARDWLSALPVLLAFLAVSAFLLLWRPAPFAAKGEFPGDEVLYYAEGNAGAVKVIQRAHDADQRWMAIEGVKIGESSGGVDHKQRVLAHFPFLLHRGEVRRVLSIGLGTGILIGEAAKHPGVEALDCVEISPEVIEAARAFDAYNGRMSANPRVRILRDDGVNFLRRARAGYDVYISDGKSRTTHVSNSVFYSLDYYRLCRRRLEPGGLMIQWVPLDLAPAELRTVVRTFLSAFAHAYLWYGPAEGCYLVGASEPLALDFAAMQRTFARPALDGLRQYGWEDPYDVAAMLVADHAALSRWVAGERTINRLERPVLEFFSFRDYATTASERKAANLTALASLAGRPPSSVSCAGADGDRLQAGARAAAALARMSAARFARSLVAAPPESIDAALRIAPDLAIVRFATAEAWFEAGIEAQSRGRVEAALEAYARACELNPRHVEAHNNLAAALGSLGRFDEAAREFERTLAANPRFTSAHGGLGEILAVTGRLPEAIAHFQEAVRLSPSRARSHIDLGAALAIAGKLPEGVARFREAARLDPKGAAPWNALAWLRATHPDPAVLDGEEAIVLAMRARRLAGDRPGVLDTLAAAYAAAGRFDEAAATAERARAAALAAGNERLAETIRQRLGLYRSRTPFRESGAGVMFARLIAEV